MKPLFEAFELAAEYRQFAELLAERHDDEQLIADTLEAIAGPLDEHLENLAKVVRNIESAEAGVRKTMEHLALRQASLERAAERARALVVDVMKAAGRDRATTALFSLALRKNPPAVVVDSPADLPADYLTYHPAPPPTPNRKAIAAALKAGLDVPGAHGEQGIRLDIH